jgi:BlaI family transcriptional regulator, penicillinase repressor
MRNALSRDRRKALSELESLVMHFVWSSGPANSEQIREGLARKHPMKDATVRTILRRLEQKGYVTHHVEGRTYIYRGLERPEKVAVGAIRQLLDRFCGGSVEQLLVGMVDHDVISSRELTELAQKIKERQKKGS